MIYDFFDDIVCINLDISVDRRQHAQYYFEKFNIPGSFYTAKKHKNGGMYGCFHSHIEVLKEAYAKDLDNILVFEDDFLPTASYSEEKLQKAIDFMKSNTDWDVMYLGYSFIKDDMYNGVATIMDGKAVTDDIIQYNPYCTQALCYSRRAIKKIVNTYQDYIGLVHYDMYLAEHLGFKNYCIVPMLFDQNFYFQHNNQAADGIEVFVRTLFPLVAFTKLNYRFTLIRYYFNKYKSLKHYLNLFMFGLLLYKLKTAVLFSVQKKYICSK